MNDPRKALAREAGLAAEQMAIGVTALGKANYAHDGFYLQAFFALSIGFERASKLALVVDHALDHGGRFPNHDTLRAYGHDLNSLLAMVDDISQRRGLTDSNARLPQSAIHKGIIGVLSDFATNITRYFNLDLVTGDPRTAKRIDPVTAWYNGVTTPILAAHLGERARSRHEFNARVVETLLGASTKVIHTSEQGTPIDNLFDASLQTANTEFAKPYIRMYVMQIARFLGRVVSELGYASVHARLETVPHLSEFFAIFYNQDSYFKRRKSWSIYST